MPNQGDQIDQKKRGGRGGNKEKIAGRARVEEGRGGARGAVEVGKAIGADK